MPTEPEPPYDEPAGAATAWPRRGAPEFVGGNGVRLLQGGDELFPAMCQAIARARHEIWLATYIFHDDDASHAVALALADAGRRGVRVGVVVDGFGSKSTLQRLRDWLPAPHVELTVFRPVDRWWSLLQPGQLRRLHQKLCVVDHDVAFVGGINVIDDRIDLRHGRSDAPRLDFAVQLQGPLVPAVGQTARALWSRAAFGAEWREEVVALARSAEPMAHARRVLGMGIEQRDAVHGEGLANAKHAGIEQRICRLGARRRHRDRRRGHSGSRGRRDGQKRSEESCSHAPSAQRDRWSGPALRRPD